ncbi:hypothetical protein LTR51_004453 [Lithohypha guttulata]|nr:hypothetical protein LTR51_004453 [Lithohypha guttulata]
MPAVRTKSHSCEVRGCTAAFFNRKDLEGHILGLKDLPHEQQVARLDLQRVKCKKAGCPWTFTCHSNMKRHAKSHDQPTGGVQKFKCPHCQGTKVGSTNSRRDNLKRRHILQCQLRPPYLVEGVAGPEDEPVEMLAQQPEQAAGVDLSPVEQAQRQEVEAEVPVQPVQWQVDVEVPVDPALPPPQAAPELMVPSFVTPQGFLVSPQDLMQNEVHNAQVDPILPEVVSDAWANLTQTGFDQAQVGFTQPDFPTPWAALSGFSDAQTQDQYSQWEMDYLSDEYHSNTVDSYSFQ